jgi:hypothetical protein
VVQAKLFGRLFNGLDKIVGFFTFGLIDLIPPKDAASDLDDDLPGGIFNGICNRLKGIVTNQIPDDVPSNITDVLDNIKCGCQLFGLGGEKKFGCNFEEPVCLSFDLPDNGEEPTTNSTDDLLAGNITIPGVGDDFISGIFGGGDDTFGFCAEANIRAEYNGRSLFTPFQKETLTTRACARLINATIFPTGSPVPKLCATVESNDGLTNLLSFKKCTLFVVRPDKKIEKCSQCDICGDNGQGVKFDCSNINLDNSKQKNWTFPAITQCLSAGGLSLESDTAKGFVYRPFLTPIPE